MGLGIGEGGNARTVVRKAERSEFGAVTRLLAEAFADDPVMRWLVRNDDRDLGRLRVAMATMSRDAFRRDETYVAGDFLGAAVWTPPGATVHSRMSGLRRWLMFVRASGMRLCCQKHAAFAALDAKAPPEPYYYLSFVGVHPSAQGRGVGSALLRAVIDRCDAEGHAAYLESSHERNVPLYKRWGFHVTEEFSLPGGGPPLWLMWREPR